MRVFLALAFVPILAFGGAAAASKPADTTADACSDVQSNAEYTGCWQRLAEQARARADAAYAHALKVAKASDLQESYGGEPKNWLVQPLQASQAAWTKYLDQQCLSEGRVARGGSGTDTLVAKCQFRLNRERTKELDTSASLIEGHS